MAMNLTMNPTGSIAHVVAGLFINGASLATTGHNTSSTRSG